MDFINFQKQFDSYQVFSLQDIRKVIPEFSYRQLDRWEKKGYLLKIKQGFYSLTNRKFNINQILFTANKIYSPSYISLEWALRFYSLIPEEIFQITCVSTKKTVNFETPVGDFSYRHIKPSLFWGYRLMEFNKLRIMVAEPEKAILDYLYLHPELKSADDFSEMRINPNSFKEQVDIDKFKKYARHFESKALSRRARVFLNTILYD